MNVDHDAVALTDVPLGAAEADLSLLAEMAGMRRATRARHLGFPMNLEFDFAPLATLLGVGWHPIGAADTPDRAALGAKALERQIIEFFARLYGAKPDEITGYTASGGTEANLWGCLQGRGRFPDAPLYFSEAAHFSIPRIADTLRMRSVRIPARRDGSMDVAALRRACQRHPGRGAVVVATIGTTMLGAMDDVPAIDAATEAAGGTHIHADAALAGLIAPFAPVPIRWAFDAGADSIAVSGHKVIGLPMPCAVALARRGQLTAAPATIEYVDVGDNLVKCCRDGLAVLLLWYAIRRLGYEGLAARACHCLRLTDYAVERLRTRNVHPWRNPASTTVVFDRPREAVTRRWRLAVEGAHAHLVVMPHVTRESIDRFADDL
jgi:histidine decarboxylase